MSSADELAGRAAELASEALKALSAVADDAVVPDALRLLLEREHGRPAVRGVAIQLLVGLEQRGGDKTPDEPGWAALAAGDLKAAAAEAQSLLAGAQTLPVDDWNYGNLLHDGHIIQGHVHLRQGDIARAESELRAAGTSPGSPQLDSFGPDLSLAWSLLELGRDSAVLDYLHGISRFWSPPGPSSQ